jgi:hypothetical protein
LLFCFGLGTAGCESDKDPSTDAGPGSNPSASHPSFDPLLSKSCGMEAPAQLPIDPSATMPIDRAELSAALSGKGLSGSIHGAVPEYSQYVFTYRDPGDFFRHIELPMVPVQAAVADQLVGLERQDEVQVTGSFVQNRSPLGHLSVSAVQLLEQHDEGRSDPYAHQTRLPEALMGKSLVYGVVHAQTAAGGVIVLEYGDLVVPVFVAERHRAAAAALYRGDVVAIYFQLQGHPPAPTHLATDDSLDEAIEVVDHLVWCHEKSAVVDGELVLFPKSPQVTLDVYALRTSDNNGMQRNWTLVNFDDAGTFQAIRDKLAAAWTAAIATAESGRNQFINRKLHVTASGTLNIVSPAQANPQILLASPDDVTVDVLD